MLQARNRLKPAKAIKSIFPAFRRLCTTLGHNSDSDGEEGEFEIEDQAAGKTYNTQYKFMDRAQIETQGGRGGNGCVSFEVLTPGKKRPTGGDGGRGGDVYIVADRGLNGMAFNTFHFNGGNGKNGGSNGLSGKRGTDVYIRVPLGTVVTERLSDNLQNFIDDDNQEWEEEIEFPSIDLDTHNATVLIVEGGRPGMGNAQMAGTSTSRLKSVPATKMPGQSGGKKSVLLELKLIADVGLVGFPNAGKSTLLKALSNARPKIAPYPFTTLHPNIGVVEYSDMEKISIADIPGLVDGASEDKGLGHDFLRHIERTKVLLFVVDGAGGDGGESGGNNPASDLRCLWKELKLYDEALVTKPKLLFINKSDLESCKGAMKELRSVARKMKVPIHYGSADKGVGIGPIANVLRSMVEKLKETEVIEAAAAAEAAAAKRLLEKDQKKANTRIRRPKIDKSTTTSTIDIKDVQKAEIVETYEL